MPPFVELPSSVLPIPPDFPVPGLNSSPGSLPLSGPTSGGTFFPVIVVPPAGPLPVSTVPPLPVMVVPPLPVSMVPPLPVVPDDFAPLPEVSEDVLVEDLLLGPSEISLRSSPGVRRSPVAFGRSIFEVPPDLDDSPATDFPEGTNANPEPDVPVGPFRVSTDRGVSPPPLPRSDFDDPSPWEANMPTGLTTGCDADELPPAAVSPLRISLTLGRLTDMPEPAALGSVEAPAGGVHFGNVDGPNAVPLGMRGDSTRSHWNTRSLDGSGTDCIAAGPAGQRWRAIDARRGTEARSPRVEAR